MPATGNTRSGNIKASITIRDVAARARVSTATVSRALASPEQVSPAARARVAEAIQATGYTPNAMARSLRARSTKIVLVLIPGMSNTFFTPILNSIEHTLWKAGYGMIMGDTGQRTSVYDTGLQEENASYERLKEAHYLRLARSGQVDGVILFTGQLLRDGSAVLTPDEIPMVLVCNEIPGEKRISVFDAASRSAVRTAVDYLVARGHRSIARIAGPTTNVEAAARGEGYKDALRAAGIPLDRGLVWGSSFRFHSGVEAGEHFLALKKRPTAVFADADDAAIGFIKTVRAAGVRVPEDVSVVGFDDIDSAQMIEPPLTTMRQPREELGRAAAADLVKRMASGGADLAPTRLRIACEFIERGSVRTIAAGPKKPARSKRPAGRKAAAPAS